MSKLSKTYWNSDTSPSGGASIAKHAGGIYCLEKIKLGGVDQWILARGDNVSNPVILFLHGGPGTAQISFAPRFQADLEKRFTVINWDQRGSGKSYSPDIPVSTMTVDRLVDDTVELIQTLLSRFRQQKLFLAGHSWGSVLGLYTASRHPQLLYSYTGLGQVVNVRDSAKILYDYIMSAAAQKNDLKTIKLLEDMGCPPKENVPDAAMLQIKLLDKFGGVYADRSVKWTIFKTALRSREYTLAEKLRYFEASSFCFNNIFKELAEVDMFSSVASVDLPVFMFIGRHDYNTPSSLTKKYFDSLKAPYKKLVWFENSGHAPQFEETDRFADEMINRVLRYSLPGS